MISELSRRYSRALYELAIDRGEVDRVLAELRALEGAIESSGLVQFLSSPQNSAEEKSNMLRAALKGKTSDLTLDTMLLLVEKNRSELLKDIVQAFEQTSDEANGVTRGSVRSAEGISADKQKALEKAVAEVTRQKVILTYDKDESLVGGMVASVGGWTFDDTLKTHLHRMSEQLRRT